MGERHALVVGEVVIAALMVAAQTLGRDHAGDLQQQSDNQVSHCFHRIQDEKSEK